MKRVEPSVTSTRFRGSVRHYHRSGPSERSSWDAWVDGDVPPRKRLPWGMIGMVVGTLLALGGIVWVAISLARG